MIAELSHTHTHTRTMYSIKECVNTISNLSEHGYDHMYWPKFYEISSIERQQQQRISLMMHTNSKISIRDAVISAKQTIRPPLTSQHVHSWKINGGHSTAAQSRMHARACASANIQRRTFLLRLIRHPSLLCGHKFDMGCTCRTSCSSCTSKIVHRVCVLCG